MARARVMFLHGFAGTPAAWDDVLAAWPGDGVDAIVPALPGHGAQAADSWDDAIDGVAAARYGSLAPGSGSEPDLWNGSPAPGAAGIRTVVGYSLGARVALGLVARDLVDRAILVSVNPGMAVDDPARMGRAMDDARWASLLRHQGVAAFAAAWEAQPLFASQAQAPTETRARRRAAREQLDPEGLARSLETMGLAAMPDLRDVLTARADRVRLIVGDRDEKFVTLARQAAARAPALAIDVIAGCGHDPTLEAPAALAALLAASID